ncbi:MAG: T9SS type A sorting domain-containing protein [Ferruginibacter sp.]
MKKYLIFPCLVLLTIFSVKAQDNKIYAVHTEYIKGIKINNSNSLSWKVSCTNTPKATMVMERSSDARNFTELHSITADAVRCLQQFDYTDTNPLSGTNFYRLKLADADGAISYSTTIALLNKKAGFDILGIQPNPVANNVGLNVTSAQNDKVVVIIYDGNGKPILKQSEQVVAGTNLINIPVQKLISGNYKVSVITGDGVSISKSFIKQ